jgi:hypothetical protein
MSRRAKGHHRRTRHRAPRRCTRSDGSSRGRPAPLFRHQFYNCVDAAGSPVDDFYADFVFGFRPRLVVDSTKVFQVWYAQQLSTARC